MHRRLILSGILHDTLPLQRLHHQLRPLSRRPASGAGFAWRWYGPHHVPDLFKLNFHHPANVVLAVVVPCRVQGAFAVSVQVHAVTTVAGHKYDRAFAVDGCFEEETGLGGISTTSNNEKDFVRSHGLRCLDLLFGIGRGKTGMNK